MRIITLILLVGISLFAKETYACKCPPVKSVKQLQKTEIENSTHIVIGKLISTENDIAPHSITYRIQITESFKGALTLDSIITVKTDIYCGIRLESGLSLIYLTLAENHLEINMCGLTRNLAHPENHILFSINNPPPLPPQLKGDPTEPLSYQDSVYNDSIHRKYLKAIKEDSETEEHIKKAKQQKEKKATQAAQILNEEIIKLREQFQ